MPQEPTNTDKEFPAESSHATQALESLGIFVGEFTHDFNNILSLIYGYAEMALSEIPEGQRARSDLEQVLAASDRAKELVARIQTYSSRTRLQRRELDLRVPLQRALGKIKDRLLPDVTLNANLTDASAMVLGNEVEIAQIVMNLCKNSVQALADNAGVITVGLAVIDRNSPSYAQYTGLNRDSYAVLTVTDNGCGMDSSTLSKIYTPFFTTHRDGRGKSHAGLGLTLVHNIVTSMEGKIFVKSAPNEGTTVELCIPLTHATATTSQPARPVEASKTSVLFIDDDPAITELASNILAQRGYKAVLFNDGNAAVEHFAAHPHEIDIIITDLNMPIISGTEVATRCAAINPSVPIILTTGFSETVSPASCSKWGISAVITKPFSIQHLIATLEGFTRKAP